MNGVREAQQVVLRVARSADRSDIAAMVDNFSEDAVLDVGGRTTAGRDAIFEFFGGATATPSDKERTKHVVTNTTLDAAGAVAANSTRGGIVRAVRNAPPSVEVVDIDEPEGNGELVRVVVTGICASDLNYLRFGSTQIAGHEFAGMLEDGTPVAVEAIFGCGACAQCEQGSYNLCERGPTGLGMTDPGGMCEWFRAPRHALVRLPRGLDSKDAALVEPASVAWHACHLGGIGADTRVAIVGAGAIGILAAASAQTMGAPDVAVEARHPHQREARERIGAVTPTGGYDVVIETGGSESALHRAVELARPGGTVVHLGVYDADTTWPHHEAFLREVALRPSLGYCAHHGRREFAEAADMLASRPELVRTLITHRFPIEDAPEAFRVAQDKSIGVFRVVVEP